MKIITFLQMPFRQKCFFCVNFVLCGIARAAINVFPYKRLAPYFGKNCRMMVVSTLISGEQIRQAILIGRGVRLAAKYTPWNSSCLTQAMVAKFWCHHYNIPYMFFIGFAKTAQKPLGQEAHAWVTAGPVAITGGNGLETHHVVSSYTVKSPSSRASRGISPYSGDVSQSST
jgi:hypothetical protein